LQRINWLVFDLKQRSREQGDKTSVGKKTTQDRLSLRANLLTPQNGLTLFIVLFCHWLEGTVPVLSRRKMLCIDLSVAALRQHQCPG